MNHANGEKRGENLGPCKISSEAQWNIKTRHEHKRIVKITHESKRII